MLDKGNVVLEREIVIKEGEGVIREDSVMIE